MKSIFKKILFTVMLLSVMLSVLCLGASATSDESTETPITGSYTNGSNSAFEWSLLDGKLTITQTCTASWSFLNFRSSNTAWSSFVESYRADVKEIYIELAEGTSVPNQIASWKQYNAFGRFQNCTKIVLPGHIGRFSGLTWYNALSLTTYGPAGTPEGTIDLSGVYRWDDTAREMF